MIPWMGFFFPSIFKGWDKLFITSCQSAAMGLCLVNLNLLKGHHMSIHCARGIYCYCNPFLPAWGSVWFCTGCCSIRVDDPGSRGGFWQLQSEAAGRRHWQVLEGLGSAHLLLAGTYNLPPQLKTNLCSLKTHKKEDSPLKLKLKYKFNV